MAVSEWISLHPNIGKAMIWEGGLGRPIAYNNWPATRKRQLEQIYSGRTEVSSTPPENLLTMGDDDYPFTRIDEEAAWSLYLSSVASSLACEINAYVPWSILDYPTSALAILFDSRQMFRRNSGENHVHPGFGGDDRLGYEFDHITSGFCVPAPATDSIQFLKTKGIWPKRQLAIPMPKPFPVSDPAQARRKTAYRMIDWCRNLIHFSGWFSAADVDLHWQYRGFTPAIRIIKQTTKTGKTDKAHFTGGCWGTTGFVRSTLRAINIPVEQRGRGSHSQLWFPLEGVGLCHSDDPYLRRHHYLPEQEPVIADNRAIWPAIFPVEELMIDEALYKQLFDPSFSLETLDHNSQTRSCEIIVKYLPYHLLAAYCDDLAKGKTDGIVSYFGGYYTEADIQTLKLRERMAAKLPSVGGCPVVA